MLKVKISLSCLMCLSAFVVSCNMFQKEKSKCMKLQSKPLCNGKFPEVKEYGNEQVRYVISPAFTGRRPVQPAEVYMSKVNKINGEWKSDPDFDVTSRTVGERLGTELQIIYWELTGECCNTGCFKSSVKNGTYVMEGFNVSSDNPLILHILKGSIRFKYNGVEHHYPLKKLYHRQALQRALRGSKAIDEILKQHRDAELEFSKNYCVKLGPRD